jgi:Zn-dependent peptidase ImmA (M78 family)
MTRGIKATVNPAVLVWARESAGYTLAIASAKLKFDEERLIAWETGEDQPSIPQLRHLAKLYKRPLAVLYLPEPPLTFQPLHDFRSLSDIGERHFSPALTLEIRRAHQRRELAIEMLGETGGDAPVFSLTTALGANSEDVGNAIRNKLGIDYNTQAGWREELVAFRAWRSRIEALGVLVFQASNIESHEASGFAYWAETLPFIVVNRKDAYPRRTFSLLHELVHLMLHQSGVSDLDVDAHRPINDQQIETFCNQVAAATLMPSDSFLSERLVAEKGAGTHEWSDETIKSLSQTYGVSREAIVRRLLTFGRATQVFYQSKRTQYATEFRKLQDAQKEQKDKKPIPRNMPRETVANLGRTLVGLVLESYHQDRLSLSEVSGYLGVKTKHLDGIKQQLGYS